MIEENDDFDGIFDEDEAQAEPVEPITEPTAETEAKAKDTTEPPTEEPAPETTEGEEPVAEQAEEVAQVPAEPNPAQEGAHIPQSAFKAMREDLKGQIAALTTQLEQQRQAPPQAQPAPQPEPIEEIPDSILDPQGFAEWQRGEIQRTATELVFKNNLAAAEARELASGKTLDDLRQEADPFIQAAMRDPQLSGRFKSSHDPVAFIRSWNAKQTAQTELAKYGGDLAAYTAAKVAEAMQAGNPAPATPQEPTVTAPVAPRSIVDTRPATQIAGVQNSDEDDFEAIFS